MARGTVDKPGDIAAYLRALLSESGPATARVCLDVALVARATEAYAAVQETGLDGITAVRAKIALLRYHGRREGRRQLSYTILDESEAPSARRCPDRILRALTPADDPNTQAWRADCRRRVLIRRQAKGMPRGALLRFQNGLEIPGVGCHQLFAFIKGTQFLVIDEISRRPVGACRIPNWRENVDWVQEGRVDLSPDALKGAF